jgi:chemotaxis protein MotB
MLWISAFTPMPGPTLEMAAKEVWELSVDRANTSRRLMQENGVNANQVAQIRGYADQRLRKPDMPDDASNRRISVIVQ